MVAPVQVVLAGPRLWPVSLPRTLVVALHRMHRRLAAARRVEEQQLHALRGRCPHGELPFAVAQRAVPPEPAHALLSHDPTFTAPIEPFKPPARMNCGRATVLQSYSRATVALCHR